MRIFFLLSVLLIANHWAGASAYDILDFFEEEATVSSASRQPLTLRQTPATVYVVTADEIRSSGAQTLWDALRAVPGVDVMALRTFHGEVAIRGLNKSLNNRVLVLLDGKTVLNGFFDYVNWESIPVTLAEIDRIEVVEGPVSAVHGSNAISGVINIVTKSPAQIQNGLVSYTAGERKTHLASALYGDQKEKIGYKAGVGWRYGHRFEDAGQLANEISKLHALVRFSPNTKSSLDFSAGVSRHNTQLNTGGGSFDDGQTNFARLGYRFKGTSLGGFWNRGRSVLRGHPLDSHLNLDYDTYDVDFEQAVALPYQNNLVAGGSYRRNTARSNVFPPDLQTQDLWALFFENLWKPLETWSFSLSGRMDKHPLTKWNFSPRGSIIYNPVPTQTFRLSAGTAFRNPTLIENYIHVAVVSPSPGPGFSTVETLVLGNPDLHPESFVFQEIYHAGKFGPVRTTAAGFHYVLSDIVAGMAETASAVPPTLRLRTLAVNRGQTEAWGGEFGFNLELTRGFSSFANYSYQDLTDDLESLAQARSAPRHKVNAGLRYRKKGWTANLWMHWVDETFWSRGATLPMDYGKVDDYLLLNARVGYEFHGPLKGLELSIAAFNLADNEHFEVQPAASPARLLQNGELIRSRWTVNATYRF